VTGQHRAITAVRNLLGELHLERKGLRTSIDLRNPFTLSRMDVPIDDHQELMARDDHASTEGTHDMTKRLGRLPRKTRQAIEAVKLEGKSVTETAARATACRNRT
jgi:DNA-directed RNA polymerase specialized sigma24 family protein